MKANFLYIRVSQFFSNYNSTDLALEYLEKIYSETIQIVYKSFLGSTVNIYLADKDLSYF